jgi:hypothetical protein
MKWQATEWDKTFANNSSDKELIARTYKSSKKLHNKETKTSNSSSILTKDLTRHFLKEEIQIADKCMKKKCSVLIVST